MENSSNSNTSFGYINNMPPEEREAGLKILKFFQMTVSVKKVYMRQLRKVISHSAFRI